MHIPLPNPVPPHCLPDEPAQEWCPRLPLQSTYAWVNRVNHDGSFWVQELPDAPKIRVKRAYSCPMAIKRGDLVLVATDGHFHYATAVLHRAPTPAADLSVAIHERAANI